MHLIWCESVRCNLCHHEVFRHCEQRLGHRIFLGRGGWKNKCYLRSKLWYWVWEAVLPFPGGYCLTSSTMRGEKPVVHYTIFYALTCRVSWTIQQLPSIRSLNGGESEQELRLSCPSFFRKNASLFHLVYNSMQLRRCAMWGTRGAACQQ